MYLLGEPKFKIITAYKPLLPMFNKANSRVPPRIEKCIMAMQDVDFELLYQPGKDDNDPLDFLSRHPLPDTGDDKTEAKIKQLMETDHAIIQERIKQESEADSQFQKLNQRILRGDWENSIKKQISHHSTQSDRNFMQ
jgi:hypothetical protein